ncbi:hypothetical protein EDD85DRAFT_961622 [Armillaria nabsnona]|nr:hypothetical protein EDD85DRAFT_961622 [Armillaria nabsnona]
MARIPGFSNRPKQAALPIDFLIVGGGITGFACAIALRRVGHRVLVLEKDATFPPISGPCRMPPNLSKILYHWGLQDELRKIGVVSGAINICLQSTGELLGKHIWDEEVLRETRGEFIFAPLAHIGDLRRLLYDTAVAVGANIRLGARVKTVNPDAQTVTLSTGEVLKADVIVGCDGPSGITRQVLLIEQEEYDDEVPINMSMYCTTIPKTLIMKDPQLKELYDHKIPTMYTWFGDKHAVLGIPLGGRNPAFGLCAYGPQDKYEGSWDEPAPLPGLRSMLESSESRLLRLSKLATNTVCVHVDGKAPLEDWVDGFMVVMGAAVHPMPPGSIQECALTVEDGAVLAKLFSHLHCKDQIKSFLWAFQDLRQPRCAAVHGKEAGIIHYMTAEPGEFQSARDDMMRAKQQAGVGILDATGDLEETPEWVEIKEVFGYDAEDDADNWWVEWGLLRERARRNSSDSHMGEVAGTKNLFSDVQVSRVITA